MERMTISPLPAPVTAPDEKILLTVVESGDSCCGSGGCCNG